MNRANAVKYALNSMEMEGFHFTDDEKNMWQDIATGKLPLSAAKERAQELHRIMRAKFPEKFGS